VIYEVADLADKVLATGVSGFSSGLDDLHRFFVASTPPASSWLVYDFGLGFSARSAIVRSSLSRGRGAEPTVRLAFGANVTGTTMFLETS
jgi:hypothetical protein